MDNNKEDIMKELFEKIPMMNLIVPDLN